MGKVVVSQFVSLDGVVEDPGGAEDFKHGGWSFKFDRGDEGNKFKLDEVMAAEVLLLGRTTYEGFAEAWPGRQDEAGFADKFNGMPKYVVSDSIDEAATSWNNSNIVRGDELVESVERLKQETEGDILVNGSVTLVSSLAEAGLIDEWRLMVFPVVLGSGKRLFSDADDTRTLKLTDTLPVGSDGVIVLTYQPV
jgi:dihydrofolate reductase